jgi:hypothetical protein
MRMFVCVFFSERDCERRILCTGGTHERRNTHTPSRHTNVLADRVVEAISRLVRRIAESLRLWFVGFVSK